MRWGAGSICALIAAAVVSAADPISSPPPVAGRSSSGTHIIETFNPDALFPKRTPPPPSPPPAPEVFQEDGLLPIPKLPPPPKLWSGTVDFGLNGAVGNSQLLNLRGGWNIRRKTDRNSLTSDFQYVYSERDRELSTHQALFNTRDEFVIPDSRWSPFAALQLEYDQLRSYRFRVGTYGGTAFRVVDTEALTFKTRGGIGATRELGSDGQPDRWVPEFLLGYDFRYKWNDRSTFVSIFDIYPRVETPWVFRARLRLAYEYVFDPSIGAVVRFGIQDRYDSDPGPAQPNDLTYFTTVGFKF